MSARVTVIPDAKWGWICSWAHSAMTGRTQYIRAIGLKVSGACWLVARGCPQFLAKCRSPQNKHLHEEPEGECQQAAITAFRDFIMAVTSYDFSINFKQACSQDAAHSQEKRITQGNNYHLSAPEFNKAGCVIPSQEGVPHTANLKWATQPAFANIFLFPTSLDLNWGKSEVLPLNPGFMFWDIMLSWIYEFLNWKMKLCFMTQGSQRILYHLRAILRVIGLPTNFTQGDDISQLVPRNKSKGAEERKHEVAAYTWVHLFILLLNTVQWLPIVFQGYSRDGKNKQIKQTKMSVLIRLMFK